jgi:transglutaminase-like putative cysteine protease
MNHLSYRVQHVTRYEYATPVTLSQQMLHLTPRPLPWQQCETHALALEPQAAEYVEREDFFGNRIVQFAVRTAHTELRVSADSTVHLRARWEGLEVESSPAWETVRERLHDVTRPPLLDPSQYLFESPHVELAPALIRYAGKSFPAQRPLLAGARDLMQRVYQDFEFDAEATTVATPLAEVMALKRGVCQDFAHLMIGCLRALGLSARYVSGYILTEPPPGLPRLAGADASHAWVSVFCPQSGWVDFDPTNNLLPDLEHITVAWGRDFSDVTPMRGVILGGGGEQELDVSVTVTPLGVANHAAPDNAGQPLP